MLAKLISAALTVAAAVLAVPQTGGQLSTDPAPFRPLEISVLEPHWQNDCLQIKISRTNRSPATLFLPDREDLVIAASGVSASSPSEQNPETAWFSVYGVSDVLTFEAAPLPAGQPKHDNVCLSPSFALTNTEKKTRREVPLRGQLRIYAFYFLTKGDWLTNKSQRESMLHTPPSKWPKLLNAQVTSVSLKIPCRFLPCDSGCDVPPLVFKGEVMLVPDVAGFEKDWIERGNAINTELARTSPQCPAPPF